MKKQIRLERAQQTLAGAKTLLASGDFRGCVSRCYYATYQAMWAAVGEPPTKPRWEHFGLIQTFVRGRWIDPQVSMHGPGALEAQRLRCEDCMISDSEQTIGSTQLVGKMQNGQFRLFKKCSQLSSRGRDKMAHKLKTKGRTVADAVLRLSQHVHKQYPQAVMTTLEVPYTDEDLTIEVAVPEEYELRVVGDDLIRTCLAIEDELGVAILTQVTRQDTEQRAG